MCGKWFMLASDHGGMLVNLKAAPGDVRALVESFNCIEPGYHMNKRHWISVGAKDGLDEDLLRSLVINSYLLVRSGLPKASRPHLSDELRRQSGRLVWDLWEFTVRQNSGLTRGGRLLLFHTHQRTGN